MKDRVTEIQEALAAANATLRHLYEAQRCLDSARNWGIVDILGGGFLSTMLKRDKMRGAENALRQARSSVQYLAREIRDVNEMMDIRLEMDGFLGFADYFFDGAIADWMVQSRISSTKAQTVQAIDMVEEIKRALEDMLRA